MFRKIAALVMSLNLLAGCAQKASSRQTTHTAKSDAEQIVAALSLSDLEPVKKRVITGAFFNEDKDVCSDAAVYSTEEKSNTDAVGVFYTDQTEECLDYIHTYLSTVKQESQYAYPSEVFKVSNAILVNNDSKVILIICEDIEEARKQAEAVLNE